MTSTRSLRRSAALDRLLTMCLLVAAALAFSVAQARAVGESITLTHNHPAAPALRASWTAAKAAERGTASTRAVRAR